MKWISRGSFLVTIMAMTLLTGCKKDDVAGGAPVVPNPDTGTPGKVDATGGFNIKVNPPDGTDYYIHRSGDFDKKCVIDASATSMSDKDIICTIEVEELEGKFHGIDMVLNVPPNMCKYVWHKPYFYFGLPYGQGPTAATVNLTTAGSVDPSSSVTGPGAIGPAGDVSCNFDYATQEGPNCCWGSMVLTKTENFGSVDPDRPPTTTVSTIDWGGKPQNCLTGAGTDYAAFNTSGIPVATVYFSNTGFSQSFVAPGSLFTYSSSVYYSNYLSGSTLPAAWTTPPAPFDHVEANRYYDWICLDDAWEQKSRIRVEIREWNQTAQFVLKAAGDPDSTGTESYWSEVYTDLNDQDDWNDILLNGDYFPGVKK